jgi:hypothetical protein
MATALPHPESLFLSASERGLTVNETPKPPATIDDKIKRLRKKRELASDLQSMITQSGLTVDELREALAAK